MMFSYQHFRDAYYPIIPVVIIAPAGAKRVTTATIIDSGAAISIFHGSLAMLLGIAVESGEKRIFQGASAKLTGYVHKVRMAVAGKEFECEVVFSDELSTSFNLFGRKGVFENFKIVFNEAEKSVELIHPSE